MPRITRVYTRSGDDGSTGLGTGRRVAKHSLRVEAFGTVDELNSQIGLALAGGLVAEVAGPLREIQNELFHLGSDLCVTEEDKERTPVPRIEQRHVDALERSMDRMSEDLGPLENFILPGGTEGASRLHVARTICRRAERLAVALAERERVGELVVPYLNRLSDTLFVMARFQNHGCGEPDVLWDSRR